ncbi:acetolactate decarboxylase [Endozoicomonas arenosclerae]|uniref:acetolactate decarboxylase n=1 Tax=Endozoicomonas arenosclerae TaxID=1633495 RepID=UPI0009A234BE|nr:acetolactate decarboxylase [Endozoicomonas arenosclerae]
MKNLPFWLLSLCILPLAAMGQERQQLFQYSTINSLLDGNYDGHFPLQKLARKGNFGLGTFDKLDGELIAVDGLFYQINADGKAHLASPDMKTPFAVVNQFTSELSQPMKENLDLGGLGQYLDSLITRKNHIQAIRIDGTFKKLTVRSIPAQKKPYRKLAEVNATDQVYFHYKNLQGTLIGYRFPDYMGNLNIPGYHFHFIDANRKFGGHLLSLQTSKGKIEIDNLPQFKMLLPDDEAFANQELNFDNKSMLKKAETSNSK